MIAVAWGNGEMGPSAWAGSGTGGSRWVGAKAVSGNAVRMVEGVGGEGVMVALPAWVGVQLGPIHEVGVMDVRGGVGEDKVAAIWRA